MTIDDFEGTSWSDSLTLSAHRRCDLSGLSPQRLDDALGLCHHTTHDLPSRLDIVHQSHALPSEKLH